MRAVIAEADQARAHGVTSRDLAQTRQDLLLGLLQPETRQFVEQNTSWHCP